jgi:hypothetical protein
MFAVGWAMFLASCANQPDRPLNRTISPREISPLVYEWTQDGALVASLTVDWIDDNDPEHEPLHGEITRMVFRTPSDEVEIQRNVFSDWWWPGLDNLTLAHPGHDHFEIDFLGGDGAGTYNAFIEIRDGAVSSYRPTRVPEAKPWQ